MTALTQAPLAASHSLMPVAHTPVRIWEICLCVCACVSGCENVLCVYIMVCFVLWPFAYTLVHAMPQHGSAHTVCVGSVV